MSPYNRNTIPKRDLIKGYVNFLLSTSKTYLHFILPFRKTYRNYFTVVLSMKRQKYPITAILRNGTIKQYNRLEEIRFDLANIPYDAISDIVTIDDIKFVGGIHNGDIVGVFIEKDYEILPVNDRVVMDVGANIADSSIYFVKRGAKKVYALEPNLELYQLAKRNIDLNLMSDIIEIRFAGCSSHKSVDSNPPFFSLEEIIASNNPTPDILKVDCEGCEYDIIMNSSTISLQSFDFILVEYHYGYRDLSKKLKSCGFRVNVSGPEFRPQAHIPIKAGTRFSMNGSVVTTETLMKPYMGYIFAENQFKHKAKTN